MLRSDPRSEKQTKNLINSPNPPRRTGICTFWSFTRSFGFIKDCLSETIYFASRRSIPKAEKEVNSLPRGEIVEFTPVPFECLSKVNGCPPPQGILPMAIKITSSGGLPVMGHDLPVFTHSSSTSHLSPSQGLQRPQTDGIEPQKILPESNSPEETRTLFFYRNYQKKWLTPPKLRKVRPVWKGETW